MSQLRDLIRESKLGGESRFHWRGDDVSRLEGLTDAAFAFALTLIVVSWERPRSVDAFFATLKGLPAFAASFFLLYWIWHAHYLFFRRYGMQDFGTRTLNCALLFLVLFYIYPMKFVITWVIANFSGNPGELSWNVDLMRGKALMIIYSGGIFAIFSVIVLLYVHTWRHRDLLRLDEWEQWATRNSIRSYLIPVLLSAVSVLLAATLGPYGNAMAGWVYFLFGSLYAVHGWLSAREWKRLELRMGVADA